MRLLVSSFHLARFLLAPRPSPDYKFVNNQLPTIVWFKRDLRTGDHAPLAAAARAGTAVVPLYVIEPSLFSAPDFAAQHWGFIRESLLELARDLAMLGSPLVVRIGEMPDVLQQLQSELGTFHLLSHQETGNALSYARDVRVGAWCRAHGVAWREFRQHGVVRGGINRDHWAQQWDRLMSQPLIAEPTALVAPRPGLVLHSHENLTDIGITFHEADKLKRQRGGRTPGAELLFSFLDGRGQHYRRAMSSPLSAADACSRLSPHIAYGTLSIREIVHALVAKRGALHAIAPEHRAPGMLESIKSFEARLHWHCHFTQKLESEPAIETHNVHRGFDGVRNEGALSEAELERLRAWQQAATGYPMIDACMKMLHTTGWINFRMRAMLMSFASYQLWLHWREPAIYLATQFLDYEPGIHYPQAQMQSGVTGINTIRIYNPIKQAKYQDPDGRFIRQWLPQLARVPGDYIFAPDTMPMTLQEHIDVIIGRDYPAPIVDNVEAMRFARDAIHAVKQRAEVQAEASRVYIKHGSRNPQRNGVVKARRAPGNATDTAPVAQMAFDWGKNIDGSSSE